VTKPIHLKPSEVRRLERNLSGKKSTPREDPADTIRRLRAENDALNRKLGATMLTDEELEDLLFAIYYLLEGASLTPAGIKKYKYLEQTILNIKRGAHLQRSVNRTCFTCGGPVNSSSGYLICENGCGGPVEKPEEPPPVTFS
jgi:hypothetical protein